MQADLSQSSIIFVIAFVFDTHADAPLRTNVYDIVPELLIALIVHLNIFALPICRLRVPVGLLFTVVLFGRCFEILPLQNDDCGCGCC